MISRLMAHMEVLCYYYFTREKSLVPQELRKHENCLVVHPTLAGRHQHFTILESRYIATNGQLETGVVKCHSLHSFLVLVFTCRYCCCFKSSSSYHF